MFKHDAIVRAWLDGKTIQTRATPNSDWCEVHSCTNSGYCPKFRADEEYRIKPKMVQYRLFLWRSSINTVTVLTVNPNDHRTQPRDKWPGFIRWISDWNEIEVEI